MSHITDGDLHAYLDQALDAYVPAEAERIRAHLESCGDCAQRLDAERALRERATGILGGADPGTIPLASLEELEARAAASAGPTDRASKSRFSLRSPYAIGMGWAATIALALWTGYSVKDFAPNPSGRRPPPAVLEPRRELDAVSADEQPAELDIKADQFRVSEVEDAARGQLSSAGRVRGGDAGAGAPADAVAEPGQDQDFALEEERQRRRIVDAELPERIDAALRKEAAQVDRPTAPASEVFADVRASAAHRLSSTVIDAETGLPLAGPQILDGLRDSTDTGQKIRYRGANSISPANEPLAFVGGSVRVPDLEIRRSDLVELPGMGQATLIVQILPNGADLELWTLTTSALAAASQSIDLEDRIPQITAHFRSSLPLGWSMAVLEREDGYLVARALLPQAELDALMELVPEGD